MTAEVLSIRAWMSSPVDTVPYDASSGACAELMARLDHRHLPVVDEEGHLGGVVTDKALMSLEMVFGPQSDPSARAPTWCDARALDLALPTEITVSPDTDAVQVLGALQTSPQDAALIVDRENHPIGIFTEHDVVRLAAELLDDDATTTDLVRRPLVAVGPYQPLRLARVLMKASRVRHLLVIDKEGVRGVLSWRDVARRGFLRGFGDLVAGLDSPVGNLVGREVIWLPDGASLREAAGRMARHKVGCLPVLNAAGDPVNVITRTDLIPPLVAKIFTESS